jgi:hypothetical protein
MYYHSFHESFFASWEDAAVNASTQPPATETKPAPLPTVRKSRAIPIEDPLLDLNEVAEILGHISSRSGDLLPAAICLNPSRF